MVWGVTVNMIRLAFLFFETLVTELALSLNADLLGFKMIVQKMEAFDCEVISAVATAAS